MAVIEKNTIVIPGGPRGPQGLPGTSGAHIIQDEAAMLAYNGSETFLRIKDSNRVWEYNPSLAIDIINADVNRTRVKPHISGTGGWQRTDVPPFVVLINSGQSNAAGSYSGGDTATELRCLAWNAEYNVTGTAFVTAEEDTAPFAKNNLGLQAARIVAAELDCAVVILNIAKGSTPIENWLPGAVAPSPDMYAAIDTEMSAIFTAAGVAPFPIEAFMFTQGGSNESLTSLTLEQRASASDPVNSWASGVLELRDRLMAEDWWGASTKFILGEGGFGDIDRFNSGIAYLLRSGKYQDLFTVNNRFEPTEPGDDLHFSGASLTRIGEKFAKIVLAPDTAITPHIIDQPMTLPLADFDHDIERAYRYIGQHFEFRDDGSVTLEMSQDITLSGVISLRGVPKHISSRIIIKGSLVGAQGAGEAGDFTSTRATDLATIEALYDYKIDSGAGRAFDVEGAVLNLEDVLVHNDSTSTFDLIDLLDAELVLHNVTLMGANPGSGSGSIVDAKNSIIRERDTAADGDSQSPTCFAYGRGADNATFRKGGALGLQSSRAILPGTVISDMALKAVIASQDSFCNFKDGTIQNVVQNAVILNELSRAITTNITYTSVTGTAEISNTGSTFI